MKMIVFLKYIVYCALIALNVGYSNMITTESGLRFEDKVEGKGAMPKPGQTVVVHYTGLLESGKKFDSSYDRNETFSYVHGVGMVIKGWEEGLSTMKVGGKRTIYIPSELGYGKHGAGGLIPPNANLIFEVELIEVK